MTRMQRQQRGIVAVLVAIGLLALLAMAGLAIDTGHLVLNKSRLQSTVDAAALAAAKVLDQTGSEAQATVAAGSVFDLNAANQPELSRVLSGADISVRYSNTLSPFAEDSTPANYVRVRADNFSMWTSFTKVVGFDELSTAASAVAGPSAPILPAGACDLVPLMVCADMPGGTKANQWGGVLDATIVTPLKVAVMSGISPGNTGLICLEEGNCGGSAIRDWLAGGACVSQNGWVMPTKTGTNVGEVEKGVGTRFTTKNPPLSDADYPPDLITRQPNPQLCMVKDDETSVFLNAGSKCSGPLVTSINQVSYSYANYKSDLAAVNYTNPSGKAKRRIVALPVVDCRTANGGRDPMKVLDFACFFLLQDRIKVSGTGNPAFLLGQYIDEPCNASGTPGSTPGSDTGPGVYKIVLHNDPNSADS